MSLSLKKLTIKGFKSIESLEDFEMRNLNILIGANGAGKSNFVEFFRILRETTKENLGSFLGSEVWIDDLFFMGPKFTQRISADVEFETFVHYGIELSLSPRAQFRSIEYLEKRTNEYVLSVAVPSIKETRDEYVRRLQDNGDIPAHVPLTVIGEAWDAHRFTADIFAFHIDDTSALAKVNRDHSIHDKYRFSENASNIASFLLAMREYEFDAFQRIRDTVRHVGPFFDDFLLIPEKKGPEEKVRLQWKQKGSDYPFQPYQLSDGTIRFICLATALLQPDPPSLLIIDEPELGLHPFAIGILAEMIQSAATRTQVIVSTQSPLLLDYFTCEDVIVVNRDGDRSTFERLDEKDYDVWLEEYSLGELWQKNVVEGGPK